MSLSFKKSLDKNLKSLKNLNEANTDSKVSAQDNMQDNMQNNIKDNIQNSVLFLQQEDNNEISSSKSIIWKKHDDYTYYSFFDDNDISSINEDKDINLNLRQKSVTQEENSQYIPFEMPRYYDGYDLTKASISIHYESSNKIHGATKPINVKYSDDKIRFGWLLDPKATAYEGKLKFEIHAYGTVTGDDGKPLSYVWKTKYNEDLNVLKSICDCKDSVNQIDKTWVQELVTNIATKIAEEIKNVAVGEQVAAAKQAAEESKQHSLAAAQSATNAVNTALKDYATTQYVDDAVKGVDVTAQLANYATKENLTTNYYNKVDTEQRVATILGEKNYATEQYVDNALASADLNNYYKKNETYNKQEIDDKVANVKVDLTGYATERFVTEKTDALSSTIATNTGNISSLGTTVGKLQDTVNSIDTSPRLTYDVEYNDVDNPDVGENVFVLYEIENEGMPGEVKSPKKKFTIVGGTGGGGNTSSTLKIGYITTSPLVISVNDKAIIKYSFSGTDSFGDIITEGQATWKIGGRIVAKNTAINGENSFDITDYLSIGTQKVNLTIVDDAGSLATKNWTVQKIDVRLDSTFNDKLTYPLGEISFDYTPHGAIEKDIHFILDGVELPKVTTQVSGIPMSYSLPSKPHGSHLLESYITTSINGNAIKSNTIVKDIIWYDSTSQIPVIGCVNKDMVVKQYDSTNIVYTVYDPSTETPTVTLAIDGHPVSTLTLNKPTNIWQYKPSDIGSHVLTITCGETVKTINVLVEKLDIVVNPVTAGLAFDFNPVGKSNNDADKLWSDKGVSMTVSDNFDWVNGGYQIDENGDQYFCVKSGTNAVINYNLFADDPKRNGKEFKVVFKTTNVKDRSTSFISCMDSNIGLDMKVEDARIYSSNNNLYSPYCEEDIVEFEFNINKDTDIPMVLTYEDGVANRPMVYTADASFMQSKPVPITIGSKDCDVHIYRMKAYSNSLNDRDILSNFIADARSADEMIARYNRNQIYDENGLLTPEILAQKCPDLRIIMIDAPWFTNDKKNKVADTNITMIYKNGDPILDNWTCHGALHSGQGTSSNAYGYSGRNLDLIMDKDTCLFTLGDGKTTSKTITLTRDSVPTDYLNVKVNIASSENENNAQMARRYNKYNPFVRSAKFNDNKVKDTMEFYNCVVFIRERNEDISTHREFQDTNFHYYALGNVGDSKKTDDTRVNNKKDPKECIVEIMDYNVPLAEFPTGKGDAICPLSEWKAGNQAYDYLYAPYGYDGTDIESFGSESYEFRYEMKGITNEQRIENIDAWREFYKFVVTSTDEEFHANLKKYFVVDSALYYYLFTERYTMVDNRAKNSFWHRGKVYITSSEAQTLGEKAKAYIVDDAQAAIDGGYRWDLAFGYDMDTSLGIGNTGKLEIPYGKEDIDQYREDDPTSSYIFRAAKSKFFCRLRDLFKTELQAMFLDRENVNAWSSDSLINQWDKYQNQFPEEVWRLDIQRKYLRTYQGISIDNSIPGKANPRFLVEMMNGRKKYQRRMFERNQELYMATKYFGNKAAQDNIMMRFNNPVGAVVGQDYTLYLTPYSNMYIGVKFGNVPAVNFRAKAGIEYKIPYSIEADTADITLIYGASFIKAIGDLSKCYVGDNDFSKASRLQKLVVGSNVAGYKNNYMTKITLGNNKLLEYLDVRNVTGLNSVIDLSQCNNLLELHAEGSGATGVIFSNGGKAKKAYLPPITSLTAKNLNNLEVFNVENYNNLQTLIVENTPFINTYDIVNSAKNLSILRLIGMDWNRNYSIADSSILNRLLNIRGVGNDGYETLVSVLSGNFHSAIVKQKELEKYIQTWKDLDITFNTMIEQYTVKFVNYNGEVLDIQYVDKGGDAVDPITRKENPIPTPTKPSTVSTDFTFNKWDSPLTDIFGERTITALYTESTRRYTVKYVSKGITLQESSGLYGENIEYKGNTPTYTLEEGAYKYYLFDRWDNSGFVNGDKTVNAIFDVFEYNSDSFVGKQLNQLRPVEIYALTKLGVENVNIDLQDGDKYSFKVGYDIDYNDIESQVIISEKMRFNGKNHLDTGVKLFDVDKNFVLAIDYEFLSGNSTNNVLAQCYQSNGSNGFKLWYNNNFAKASWGTSTLDMALENNREMIVIRHKKGSNNLIIYNSNLDGVEVKIDELTRTRETIIDSTLVFGCSKADDGAFENHAIGDINWCKVWYEDLGNDICKKIAGWTHEELSFEVCGFKKYYLSDNPSQRCSFSLLGTHLLERNRKYNSANTNVGGWANAELNSFLNTRLYNSVPHQIKSLIKKVTVASSIGNQSTETSSSNCYIYIPSLIEVCNENQFNVEPYIYEGSTISYMINNDARKRAYANGVYRAYWLRSPNASYPSYIYQIEKDGSHYGFANAYNEAGVLVEISF